ncbi:hypothetical protein MGLY_10570 [Neomoorella glycerini]|uniref:Uncharacterized protein n=1 Tax=Neomoorella glycerini TaxID=55779 RepID=A0A6I5ZQ21_9FIRM|nr:hypothetical protein [Moorella glycerini]QGP91715.1 hypothetical protein MGLY_10570 [Moorella glycerini]
MAELVDILVDDDGNFVLAPDGDAAVVTDKAVILQDIKHEIMTYLGGIPWHPEYGGKLQEYLKDEGTPINQKAMARELAVIVAKHPNVLPGSVSAAVKAWEGEAIELETGFRYTLEESAAEASAALVVIIDKTGVRVYEA